MRDGILTSQNGHLIGVWMPGSFPDQIREGRGGNKVKRRYLVNISRNGKSQAGRSVIVFLTAIYKWTGI